MKKGYWFIMGLLALCMSFMTQAQNTVNLINHQPASLAPAGATFEWHTGLPISAGNLMTTTQIQATVAGVYYGVYNYGTCYSAAAPLRVISTVCPSTTLDLRSVVDSTSKPSGMLVSFHSSTPATSVNKLSDLALQTASAGTYFAAYYDMASMCYSATSPIVVVAASCVSCLAGTVAPVPRQ